MFSLKELSLPHPAPLYINGDKIIFFNKVKAFLKEFACVEAGSYISLPARCQQAGGDVCVSLKTLQQQSTEDKSWRVHTTRGQQNDLLDLKNCLQD